MERNERLKAADKCASKYTNENEAHIARAAFMLGCEFEAKGEIAKGVILETEEVHWKPTEEQMKALLTTHPKVEVPEKYKNPDWLLKKQEQLEVDLDELINDFLLNNSEFLVERDSKAVVQKLARHFYELGRLSNK